MDVKIATYVSERPAKFGGIPARPTPIEARVLVSAEARARLLQLFDEGQLSNYYNGPWARSLEEQLARFHGPTFQGVAVNSGTSAIHLALTAAGVGRGDEVIVPALCFVAAATAVVQIGAVPVICDAKPDCLTLDLEMAECLITDRTKAILPVHFWGYPSDSAGLEALCRKHGITLIEDCAQAYGATINSRKVGTFGRFATFAMSQRKHVACGEGGFVLCRDPTDHDTLRKLSNYGKGPGWDDYDMPGFSYRMAEAQAIIALDGLMRLQDEIGARRAASELYREALRSEGATVVPEPDWGRASFFKCPIFLPDDLVSNRDEIVDAINSENVSCRIPHRPLFAVPWLIEYLSARRRLRTAEDCPVAANAHRRLIEIETGPHLPLNEAEISCLAVQKVARYFRHRLKA